MSTQIFVNLPVADLDKSIGFFTQLGFKFNSQFTNQNATCMIVDENIFVMLLVKPFFKSFIKKEISDATKTTEVLMGISAESRAEVDKMFAAVIKAGGKEARKVEDHGWMYGRSFEDLDGHIWEVICMDESKMPEEMKNKK